MDIMKYLSTPIFKKKVYCLNQIGWSQDQGPLMWALILALTYMYLQWGGKHRLLPLEYLSKVLGPLIWCPLLFLPGFPKRRHTCTVHWWLYGCFVCVLQTCLTRWSTGRTPIGRSTRSSLLTWPPPWITCSAVSPTTCPARDTTTATILSLVKYLT